MILVKKSYAFRQNSHLKMSIIESMLINECFSAGPMNTLAQWGKLLVCAIIPTTPRDPGCDIEWLQQGALFLYPLFLPGLQLSWKL